MTPATLDAGKRLGLLSVYGRLVFADGPTDPRWHVGRWNDGRCSWESGCGMTIVGVDEWRDLER